MYVMPPLLLIFTHSFPAALTFYWLSTNIFSVGQVCMLLCFTGLQCFLLVRLTYCELIE